MPLRLRRLFCIETLDNRLVPSEPGSLPNSRPPQWRSPEYKLFYTVIFTSLPLMFYSAWQVSQPSHPGYKHFEHLLSPGWIPGLGRAGLGRCDNSDEQYAGFRGNLLYLGLLVVVHPLLRKGWEVVRGSFRSRSRSGEGMVHVNGNGTTSKSSPNSKTTSDSTTPSFISESESAATHFTSRTSFDLLFGLLFLLALHGISAFKILAILYANYCIATRLPRSTAAPATWIFNVGILFANELGHGYPLVKLVSAFTPAGQAGSGAMLLAARLDGFGGLMPRWEVLFNFTILRLISFNFDYLWLEDRGIGGSVEKKAITPATAPTEKERITTGALPTDFTLANYLAYTLYAPLFLAGPILTFNDYTSQSRHPLPATTRTPILPYALRFAVCLATMELSIHLLYPIAIAKASPDWRLYTPFQLAMLAYFSMHHVWLKLLLPWRLFRLWALVDGVDPPENMMRCMSDAYSPLAFWRGWHRSFNAWVLRYIYIPLGGSRSKSRVRVVANFVAVFTFVAVWHDINLRLLIWGWLIVLFVLPELAGTTLLPPTSPISKGRPVFYRWVSGAGAVFNMLLMMAANLVGFAVGLDGLWGIYGGVWLGGWYGRLIGIVAASAMFTGVMVMFEVREGEKRRGVKVRC